MRICVLIIISIIVIEIGLWGADTLLTDKENIPTADVIIMTIGESTCTQQ